MMFKNNGIKRVSAIPKIRKNREKSPKNGLFTGFLPYNPKILNFRAIF